MTKAFLLTRRPAKKQKFQEAQPEAKGA